MKSKKLSLISLSILSFLLMVNLVSATIDFSSIPLELSQSSGSFTINVSTNELETISFSSSTITSDGKTIVFSPVSALEDFDNNSSVINVTYVIESGFEFELAQIYTTTFKASGNVSGDKTQDISFVVSDDFCGDCNNIGGDLEIDVEIEVVQGFGDDTDYWYPFDVIEAQVEVKNDGKYDIEDIEVSWVLYTEDGTKIADDEESDFNLDEDEDETLTLKIKLDENIDDFEDINELTLYIRAKGRIDDSDSDDDGNDTCVSEDITVDLISDDDFVILDNMEINSIGLDDWELTGLLSCGTELQIIADVWNVGEDDQDDVSILIYNKELGISKTVKIGDIDAFDHESLNTYVYIPSDAEEKYYSIEFKIYDEDNDIFENSEDDKASFNVLINVEGGCKIKDNVEVIPTISSGGNAGEKLVVKTTITNTDNEMTTYIINVKGYEDWATFDGLESNSITLVETESRDIELVFYVNEDVENAQNFEIEIIASDEIVKTQPVTVSIVPQKNILKSVLNGQFNNWYIWLIGILNVLLIGAIIFVAIRVSKE